jgi:hypothetical protein
MSKSYGLGRTSRGSLSGWYKMDATRHPVKLFATRSASSKNMRLGVKSR